MHGFHLIRQAHSYTVSTHSRSLIIRNYPIAIQSPQILIWKKSSEKASRPHRSYFSEAGNLLPLHVYCAVYFIYLLGRTRWKSHTVSKPVHGDDSLQTQQRCRLHFSRKQQFIPPGHWCFLGWAGLAESWRTRTILIGILQKCPLQIPSLSEPSVVNHGQNGSCDSVVAGMCCLPKCKFVWEIPRSFHLGVIFI